MLTMYTYSCTLQSTAVPGYTGHASRTGTRHVLQVQQPEKLHLAKVPAVSPILYSGKTAG